MNREGHPDIRFVAGISEHKALVSGPLGMTFRFLHTDRNGLTLLMYRNENGTILIIEPVVGIGIADFLQGLADDGGNIGIAVGGNLSRHQYKTGGGQYFTGHPGVRILTQDVIENGIRYLITDLVGMTFGDGFRRKDQAFHR